MYWNTSVDEDYRGLWLIIEKGFMAEERLGPYGSMEEAKSAELKARLELGRQYGPSKVPASRSDSQRLGKG